MTITWATDANYSGLTGALAIHNGQPTKRTADLAGHTEEVGFVPRSPVCPQLLNQEFNTRANAGGQFPLRVNVQEFTASGTYTAPAVDSRIVSQIITLVGAGGGGSSGARRSSGAHGGAGGGSGQWVESFRPGVTLPDGSAVVIGAAGAGGAAQTASSSPGSSGADGGLTSCGDLSAAGGPGGSATAVGDYTPGGEMSRTSSATGAQVSTAGPLLLAGRAAPGGRGRSVSASSVSGGSVGGMSSGAGGAVCAAGGRAGGGAGGFWAGASASAGGDESSGDGTGAGGGTGYGAGGGGGSAADLVTSASSGAGGDGAPGWCRVVTIWTEEDYVALIRVTPFDDLFAGLGSNLQLAFDRDVVGDSLAFELRRTDNDSLLETVTGTVSGDTVTLDPTADLSDGVGVYILAGSDCIVGWEGIDAKTVWNFTPVGEPSVSLLTPLNGAGAHGTSAAIEVQFDRDVFEGLGDFELRRVADDSLDSIVNVADCVIVGDTVTIPFSDRAPGVQYYVLADAGTLLASSGTPWTGISASSVWAWTAALPVIESSTPPDDGAIAITDNLTLTFTADAEIGTGDIEIRRESDDTLVEAFDVTALAYLGSTLTIDPTSSLPNELLYVLGDAGAITGWAGISDPTELSFYGASPAVASLSPTSGDLAVLLDADLVITFDEDVYAGSGTLYLMRTLDDTVIEAFGVGDVVFAGATITIDPASDITAGEEFYVLADDGFALGWSGFAADTDWAFSAVVDVPEIVGHVTRELNGNDFDEEISTTLSPTAGNLLLAIGTRGATGSSFDGPGAPGWTLVDKIGVNLDAPPMGIWYREATGDASDDFDFDFTSPIDRLTSFHFLEIENGDTTNPVDVYAFTQSASAISHNMPALTSSNRGTLALAVLSAYIDAGPITTDTANGHAELVETDNNGLDFVTAQLDFHGVGQGEDCDFTLDSADSATALNLMVRYSGRPARDLVSLSPDDGADGASGEDLVITVDGTATFGGGDPIELRLVSDDSLVESFGFSDVVFAGNACTFTPSTPLSTSAQYYILVPPGFIDGWSGITGTSEWAIDGGVTYPFIQYDATQNSGGTTTSFSPTLDDTEWSSGDLLIWALAIDTNEFPTAPAGWTTEERRGGSSQGGLHVFSRVADGTSTDEPSMSFSGANHCASIFYVMGNASGVEADVNYNFTTGSPTSFNSTLITTTGLYRLVLAFFEAPDSDAAPVTVGAPFEIVDAETQGASGVGNAMASASHRRYENSDGVSALFGLSTGSPCVAIQLGIIPD